MLLARLGVLALACLSLTACSSRAIPEWIEEWEKNHPAPQVRLREIEGLFENGLRGDTSLWTLWYALTGVDESLSSDQVRLSLSAPGELKAHLIRNGSLIVERTFQFRRDRFPIHLDSKTRIHWGLFPLFWATRGFETALAVDAAGQVEVKVDGGYAAFIGPLPLLGGPSDDHRVFPRVR